MNQFGQVMVVPAGYLTARYGVRGAYLGSMFLTTGAFLLLWTSTYTPLFYKAHAYLLHIYYFIAGELSQSNSHIDRLVQDCSNPRGYCCLARSRRQLNCSYTLFVCILASDFGAGNSYLTDFVHLTDFVDTKRTSF